MNPFALINLTDCDRMDVDGANAAALEEIASTYFCGVCRKSFKKKKETHIAEYHAGPYCCKECGKELTNRKTQSRHQIRAHGLRTYYKTAAQVVVPRCPHPPGGPDACYLLTQAAPVQPAAQPAQPVLGVQPVPVQPVPVQPPVPVPQALAQVPVAPLVGGGGGVGTPLPASIMAELGLICPNRLLVPAPDFPGLPLKDKLEVIDTWLSEDDRRGMSMTQGNKYANTKYKQCFAKFCNFTFDELLKSVDDMRDNHKPGDRDPPVAFDRLVEQIKDVRDQQKKAHPDHPRAGNFVLAEFECVINPTLVNIVRLTHKFFDKVSLLTQHVQCIRAAITVVEQHYNLNETAKSNVEVIRKFLHMSALAATRNQRATSKANMLKKLLSPDPMGSGGAPNFVACLLKGALVLMEDAIRALNTVINSPAPQPN